MDTSQSLTPNHRGPRNISGGTGIMPDLVNAAAKVGAGGVGAGAGIAAAWKLFSIVDIGKLLSNPAQGIFAFNVLIFVAAVALLAVYLTAPVLRADTGRSRLVTSVIAFLFLVAVVGFFVQMIYVPQFAIRIRFQPTMTDLERSAARNLQFKDYNAALSVELVPERGDQMSLDDGKPHEIAQLHPGDLLEVEVPHLEQYMTFSKADAAANASCTHDLCTGTATPTN
jgi:hypothetical protein